MNAAPCPPVDLTSCDLEPIHIIGRIQSFGYLIAFSGDWTVSHASANCAELTGRDAASLIGLPAATVLAGEALHEIRSRFQMLGSPDAVERLFDVDLAGDGRRFDLAVHATGRSFVLECEPAGNARHDYAGTVRPLIHRMRGSGSVEVLCAAAAKHLRGLTGFDRVMIYRFEPGGAGEVIAESRREGIDGFLGLHFPASDIPAQARRLYARNILRIISDVDDPTVPIVPAADPGGEPLDLSMSGLRAVSPIHIEYLRNMGVKASMSVSIMRRGELWGLMACHHYAPLRLPFPVRTAAELFGEFFSCLLDQAIADTAAARRGISARLHDEIMARVAGGGSLIEVFSDFSETIASIIPFDGIAGWVDGAFVSKGDTPDRDRFVELTRFLDTASAGHVWSSDHLSAAFPPAAGYVDCCAGVLALPVSRSPRDYIVLFRRELVHSVHWAGNPEKSVRLGPNGARLTPRQSFDLWREERRGFSRPWTAEEIAAAESLRVTLLEVVLRIADATHHERELANQRQDVLIAELNHRVRNILNLIRGVVSQSRSGSKTIDQFAETIGQRISSLSRAHDMATRGNWSPASLHELVRTECEAYLGERRDRVTISGADALITPSAFATMALVVHELMTNSCKYGALSDARGSVAVAIGRRGDGALEMQWREQDGPPVKTPKRRGFGSSIIERTIPHELGGTADVDYRREGLIARFTVPDASIADFVQPADAPPAGAEAAEDAGFPPEHVLSGEALIVEDNMIIAMEAEDILRELGCDPCHIAGSVRAALAIVAARNIAFGLLDVDLGGETAEAIAHALLARGTPFVFASGYGAGRAFTGTFPAIPVVTKPYTAGDIRQAIAKLRAGV